MVRITFQDRATERRALAFLLGRFSGRVLKGGEHLVPDAALEALAGQDIPFGVKGKASKAGPSIATTSRASSSTCPTLRRTAGG